MEQIQIQANLVPLKAQFNADYHAKRPYYHDVGNFFGTCLSETGLNEILSEKRHFYLTSERQNSVNILPFAFHVKCNIFFQIN